MTAGIDDKQVRTAFAKWMRANPASTQFELRERCASQWAAFVDGKQIAILETLHKEWLVHSTSDGSTLRQTTVTKAFRALGLVVDAWRKETARGRGGTSRHGRFG